MRLKNRITLILKSASGASILFVLGIMMFLMAIGVSTLVAASANAGFLIKQRDYSKVQMLDRSVHDNIMYSLSIDPELDNTSLAYQLAWDVFEAKALNPATGRLDDVDLRIEIDGVDIHNPNNIIHVESITLSFPGQIVDIKGPIPGVPPRDPVYGPDPDGSGETVLLDPGFPGIPRIPRTASESAIMFVEVVINARIVNGRARTITSRAVYEYPIGRLSDLDESIDAQKYDPDPNPNKYPMQYLPGEYGKWSLLSYEIIDT